MQKKSYFNNKNFFFVPTKPNIQKMPKEILEDLFDFPKMTLDHHNCE